MKTTSQTIIVLLIINAISVQLNGQLTRLGDYSGTLGPHGTYIGSFAGHLNTSGQGNVFLGHFAGYENATGSYNTALGSHAGELLYEGSANTLVGSGAGYILWYGSNNVFMGSGAGYDMQGGNNNVLIGKNAGRSSQGSDNVFLGSHAGYNEQGSHKLYIANSSTSSPLIYGEFNNSRLFINGNVRIGTGTTNPTEKLDVRGRIISNTVNPFIQFKHNDSNIGIIGSDGGIFGGTATNMGLYVYGNNSLELSTNNTKRLVIRGDGKIGIGTTTPDALLHINNGPNTDAAVLATSTENNKLIVSSGVTSPAYISTFKITHEFGSNRNNGYIHFHRGGSYDGGFLTFGTNGRERLRIDSYGNIGIGLDSTTAAAAKLDVCGTIRAREVKIDMDGICAPDYVFKEGYQLMGLQELEQFVQTNHHLPEIPSEKEMHENGVNLMELQMKLLQKIEELTLYTIRQEQRINDLEETINKQAIAEKLP